MTARWHRWRIALLHWAQRWVGETLLRVEGPTSMTPEIAAAFDDVAAVLPEVRRHMHNVKAAYPTMDGEGLRQRALMILRQKGMAHRRAAFAIELVIQQWM